MTFDIPFRQYPRSFAKWLALAVFASPVTSQAQTLFSHDAKGNRTAQTAAGVPTAPVIAVPPKDQVAKLGGTARFSVLAGGPGPFTYQWFKGAAPIGGAMSDTLAIENLTGTDFTPSPTGAPKYSVRVTNAHSSVTSAAVGLYEDSLGSGLPNWWRQQYFGTLGAVDPNADADGDGVTNGQEYADGTQPNNAASRQARVTLVGPTGLVSKFPDLETYAAGSSVTASGGSAGELQFGGWTGSHRSASSLGFNILGSGGTTGDVVLKGLFGSMPVQTTAGAVPSFTYSDYSAASVTGFATAPNGQWIAWGFFNRVNDQPRLGAARFQADGTLDASFNPSPNSIVHGVAILPDGKVLIAGLFTEINGQPRSGIVRLLANGTLDPGFATEAGGDSLVVAVEPQRDGKVLLGGQVWDGSAFRLLMRRNVNGSIDSSFTTTTDTFPTVFRQQPDGRILMGGTFTTVNGTATPKLVRLNLDGTLDPSFSLAVAAGAVTSEPRRVVVQPDGRILVGGTVQVRLNGNTVSVPVARLNADGTLDSTFTQKVHALAANLAFSDLTLQDDGRIVGAGTFTLANPTVVNAVRFKADGSVDPNCFVISRPNAPVLAVASQVDGSLLFGGSFSSIAAGAEPGNNHAYYFTAAKSGWRAAEAEAVRLGGHLVSIGGQTEQLFLNDTLIPLKGLSRNPVWLGLGDHGVESLFAWSSGEPATFANWHPGNPDNYGGNEDYATINWGNAQNATGPGMWNDTPEAGSTGFGGNSDGPYYGIIEADPGAAPPTTNHWVAGRDLATNELAGSVLELTNPNGSVPQWSYGTRSTQTSATMDLNLFVPSEHDNRPAEWEGWTRQPGYATVGVVTRPDEFPVPSGVIRRSELNIHPPPTGFSVVRWTAPQAGLYSITAFWQDVNWSVGDGAQASIIKNGTNVVFDSIFDNGNGASTNQILTLSAGDVLDFLLGTRQNDLADSVRFNATVTKIQNTADVWVGGRDLAANEKPDGHANETTNPNPTVPQWSYGHRNTLVTSGINLFSGAPSHINSGAGGGPDDALEGWSGSSTAVAVNTGTAPIAYNYGFGPNLPFNPGEMIIAPGSSSGPFPVVRWTAPAAGRYEVLAYWQDVDFHGGNGLSAHLLVNGGQVYGQDIDNAHGSSIAQSLDLKAGDQVDFLMGTRGDYTFDTTKFDVAIVRPGSSTIPSLPSGTLSQAATRAEIGSDAAGIDWVNAGPLNTDLPGNPLVIESTTGPSYLVRKSTTGPFKRLAQGSGWAGNFAAGDALLNHGNSDGPVIIEAADASGVFSAIGMQIQPNQDGPFVATIRAYDRNGVLLGTFTANGTSNANADNSAVFIGAKCTVENIHSVSVDTDTSGFGGDFAINRVSIRSTSAGSGNFLSNPRAAFARLVTTNHLIPGELAATPAGPIYAANAPATLSLWPGVPGDPITFVTIETSADGVSFRTIGYGTESNSGIWSFPVTALPPGANYFRAVLTNTRRETARTHAVGPLIAPPQVTSPVAVAGELGTPFSYTGTATGRLTGFTATSLPAWATATFDANSSRLTISGTPTATGVSTISLLPANAAGSTPATLTLTVFNQFANWQTTNFTASELLNPAISGPLGDATGAGIENLIKYALGIPPKLPGTAGMPSGSVQPYGAFHYLTLVYTRDKAVQDLSLVVEVSGDVEQWDSGPAHTTEVSRVSNPDNTETITVRDNVAAAAGQTRFMRLKVVR